MNKLNDLRNRKIFLESKIKLCEEHRLRIRRGLHALHIQHNKGLIENEKLYLELNKLHSGRTLQQWIEYYDNYVQKCKEEIKEIDRRLSKDNILIGVRSKTVIAFLVFVFVIMGMFMLKPLFTGHATYIVNNQSSFNEGIYNYTFFNNTGLTFVQLNASNSTGNYTSKVYDAGSAVRWGNISWVEGIPYGEELPNGTYDEKKNNILGGANMTRNVLLLHLNDSGSSTQKDESGLVNTGYMFNINTAGNATSGPTSDCKFGNCILLDGSDDYINVSDNNLLNFDTSTDFSVGVWFKTSSVGQWIIAKSRTGGSGDSGGWIIRLNGPNISASLTANSGFGAGQITGPAVNDSNWHHIILAMNRNGGATLDYTLYTDGNSVTTSGASLNITVPVNLTIGMQMNQFGQAPSFLNGTIDEVVIYNRTLSAAEVMEHYKRGALRLNVTVRSCDDSACSGESFNSTRFENATFNSLNNVVTNNRYFQYQTFFFTESSANYTPELYNVTVNYTVISNAAPNTPTLNSPENYVNLSSASVLLNTTVSDNDGDTLTVWFYGNESIINTTTGVSNGSLVTYNWTGLSDRNYNWSIIVGDGTANTSSGTYYFTIDTTKPTINFVSPTDNTNINVSRNWIYVNVSTSDTNWHTAFTDFNKSLVGWWRFNNESGENSTFFRDWSNYGNNGTCSGTGCPAYNQSGKFGSAYTFDGSNDFINLSNSATLNPIQNITIETWVKIKDTTSQNIIVGKYATTGFSYNLEVYLGYLRFFVRNGDTEWRRVVSPQLQKNIWYHVVGTYNGTDLFVYVNGDLGSNVELIGTNPGSIGITNTPVYIGRHSGSSGFFNGTIDEVQIWNRTLSAEEIKSSFNAGIYRLFQNYTNLNDGTYTFTSYAQDSAGNVNNTETRTVTVDINSPTIPEIQSISAQSPTEASTTKITFETNISDLSGTGAISSVRASFTKSGETTRSNNTCISVVNVNNTFARYQCSIDMYWYDAAGAWSINVTAYDGATNSGTNTSTTLTYNSLKAFTIGPSSGVSTGLIWPLISLRDTNKTSNNDPLLLNNTGNSEISSGGINVTAYNLIGETINTQYLPVANMSVHFANGSSDCSGAACIECAGNVLTNNTATIITSANITKGNYTVNDGTTGQEQLYFCLKNVLSSTSIAQQSYSTAGGSAWIITI